MLIEDGTTARSSDIHHRQLGVLVGEGVAVHTAVLQLFIVAEGIHIEVFDATLLDLYVIPYLIVGFNEPVGQVRIHLVAHNVPVEGRVLRPCSVNQGSNGDFYLLVCRLLHQRFPVVYVEHGLIAPGVQRQFSCLHFYSLTIGTQQEVQRGDVLRNGHIAIVRIDRRQLAALLHVLWCRRTGNY